MISRRRFLVAAGGLPLILAGCGGDTVSADEPPEIKLGRDICGGCRMIISDERFASAIVAADATAALFDDPGEMILAVQGGDKGRSWVHDFSSMEWLDATGALYVTTNQYPTPMGTGVVAFRDESSANVFADEKQGEVRSWQSMLDTWSFTELS